MSGALIIDQRTGLQSMLGEEEYRRVLSSLPAEVRETYEAATGVSWVPCGHVDQVITAAARHVGRHPLEFHADLSRKNVERTLRGIWRVLLRFTGDRAIVQRTPLMYRKTFDTGELEGAITEPGHAEVILRGWPEISDIHLVGLQMGVETVLSITGRPNVRCSRRRTPEGAVFDLRWSH
ncbi:MAG: hypothetical protein ACOC5B_03740 [Myxococcota bacterium]